MEGGFRALDGAMAKLGDFWETIGFSNKVHGRNLVKKSRDYRF